MGAVSFAFQFLSKLFWPAFLGGTPRRYRFFLISPDKEPDALRGLNALLENGTERCVCIFFEGQHVLTQERYDYRADQADCRFRVGV
jgi:hypothetical protein